uniref:Uncharacterized protein n=1 Tax=Myoviridae sp. ctCo31 TaxID=2825053 RepID=A0A8S5UMK2_9CAUD|nr:MAG TPA: hypothetical protein [Myoviridae sp. ctCo31]
MMIIIFFVFITKRKKTNHIRLRKNYMITW